MRALLRAVFYLRRACRIGRGGCWACFGRAVARPLASVRFLVFGGRNERLMTRICQDEFALSFTGSSPGVFATKCDCAYPVTRRQRRGDRRLRDNLWPSWAAFSFGSMSCTCLSVLSRVRPELGARERQSLPLRPQTSEGYLVNELRGTCIRREVACAFVNTSLVAVLLGVH